MRLRLPLYARILLWFLLNLGLLGAVFLAAFKAQFQPGLDALLAGPAGDRFQSLAGVIAAELVDKPRADWSAILQRFSQAYQIRLSLHRADGLTVAGENTTLPPEVQQRLRERRGPGPGWGRRRALEADPERPPPGPRGFGPPTAEEFRARPLTPFPKAVVRSQNPRGYWVVVHLPGPAQGPPPMQPMSLVAWSESLRFGGLLFDPTPWVVAGFGGLILSVLFWIPLVRGITRAIGQMTAATARIAEGGFEVRVPERRTDELGTLAAAINRMAARLEGFVTGQRRFLGDIAHELCSPLARIQLALGILEQRADERQQGCLEDLHAEVQQMSGLVNELLSFSKASLRQKSLALGPVHLGDVVRRALEREAPDGLAVRNTVDPQFAVLADAELLTRAVANLLRNAIRYAGTTAAIEIAARAEDGNVALRISDSGPGVPPETLEHLFTPFYRPDAARSPDTGGTGLGLAIVKTCVEACRGTVTCRNREPHGFEVEIRLARAEAAPLATPASGPPGTR